MKFRKCLIQLFLFCVYTMVTANSSIAATTGCSSTTPTQFVPSWGAVNIGENSRGRYIYQRMYWNSDSRLKWFKDNFTSTFEPEALFYNYNNTYGPAYGGKPTGYWSSNLPSAYVDTQRFDSNNEKAVIIGSAYASGLKSRRTYYTFTYMTNGGGNRSIVKISSQRGRRVPWWCWSANCSFGCSNTNYIQVIPFSAHFWAPGGISYTYP